jgi:hypothetical protein
VKTIVVPAPPSGAGTQEIVWLDPSLTDALKASGDATPAKLAIEISTDAKAIILKGRSGRLII